MTPKALKCLALLGLLLALACKKEEQETSPPAPTPESKQTTAPSLPPYTVQVVFNGLTAFAEDSGKVRAFLINGDYDPKNPDPDLLPRGILSEIPPEEDKAQWLAFHLPPHYSWIRILHAKITGGAISRCVRSKEATSGSGAA